MQSTPTRSVASLAGHQADALSIRREVDDLLAGSWTDRLSLLARDSRLTSASVAGFCEEHGEPLLAGLINRIVETDFANARAEFALAERLLETSGEDQTIADEFLTMATGPALTTASWLLPLVAATIDGVIARPEGASAQIADMVQTYLVARAGSTTHRVIRVIDLVRLGWDSIWSSLPDLAQEEGLGLECQAARIWAAWVDVHSGISERVYDLERLWIAARGLGVDRAIEDHQIALAARTVSQFNTDEEGNLLDICFYVAEQCNFRLHYAYTGWLAEAGLLVARRLVELTPPDEIKRPLAWETLSVLLAQSVLFGVAPPTNFAEAARCAFRSYVLTPLTALEQKAARASNLATMIGQGVQFHIFPKESLIRVQYWAQRAYDLSLQNDSNRSQYTSKLSSAIAEAVRNELASPELLLLAIERQRAVLRLVEFGRATYASILGTLLMEALRAGVIEPSARDQAVREGLVAAAEAYALTPERHPSRATMASNLGNHLMDAIEAGIDDVVRLSEAIAFSREGFHRTAPDDPERPRQASNLAAALTRAFQFSAVGPEALTEAVGCALEAYRGSRPDDPLRPGYLLNVALVIGQAAEERLVDRDQLGFALDNAREAFALSAPGLAQHRTIASSLAVLLIAGIASGNSDETLVIEAVALAREGYSGLLPRSPNRAFHAGTLSLALGYACEIQPEEGLTAEAIRLAREACATSTEDDSNYQSHLLNLSELLSYAVLRGHADRASMWESLSLARAALALTSAGSRRRLSALTKVALRLIDLSRVGLAKPIESANEVMGLVDEVWGTLRNGITYHERHAFQEITRDLCDRVPLLLLEAGRIGDSVRAIESLRGHLGAGMRAPLLRPGIIASETETAYLAAAEAYSEIQQLARERLVGYAVAAGATEDLQRAIALVRATGEGLRDFGGPPMFRELARRVPPDCAAIYLIPGLPEPLAGGTPWPGRAVVIRDGRATEVSLPELTVASVSANANRMLTTSKTHKVCSWLWKAVARPLLDDPSPGLVKNWRLILTGQLGLLPIHGAGSAGRGWLDDRVAVCTVPSLLIQGDRLALRQATGAPVVAVDSAPDLLFLRGDRAVASAWLKATPIVEISGDNVLIALADSPAAVMSGHGAHSLLEGGALRFLSSDDGESSLQWVTAESIDRLQVLRRQIAFLSACSTGQVGAELPDESIGLPAALLRTGFQSVIATGWPVADRVAFLTLARFVQLQGLTPLDRPSEVLRRTRRWLRSASVESLQAWLTELEGALVLPLGVVRQLRKWWQEYPGHYPLDDPQDWAVYGAVGD